MKSVIPAILLCTGLLAAACRRPGEPDPDAADDTADDAPVPEAVSWSRSIERVPEVAYAYPDVGTVTPFGDGESVFAAMTNDWNPIVTRYDGTGEPVWSSTVIGTNIPEPTSLAVVGDSVYLTGFRSAEPDTGLVELDLGDGSIRRAAWIRGGGVARVYSLDGDLLIVQGGRSARVTTDFEVVWAREVGLRHALVTDDRIIFTGGISGAEWTALDHDGNHLYSGSATPGATVYTHGGAALLGNGLVLVGKGGDSGNAEISLVPVILVAFDVETGEPAWSKLVDLRIPNESTLPFAHAHSMIGVDGEAWLGVIATNGLGGTVAYTILRFDADGEPIGGYGTGAWSTPSADGAMHAYTVGGINRSTPEAADCSGLISMLPEGAEFEGGLVEADPATWDGPSIEVVEDGSVTIQQHLVRADETCE